MARYHVLYLAKRELVTISRGRRAWLVFPAGMPPGDPTTEVALRDAQLTRLWAWMTGQTPQSKKNIWTTHSNGGEGHAPRRATA